MAEEYRKSLSLGLPKDVRARLLEEHKKYPEENLEMLFPLFILYYKQDIDNKIKIEDKYIASSIVCYF